MTDSMECGQIFLTGAQNRQNSETSVRQISTVIYHLSRQRTVLPALGMCPQRRWNKCCWGGMWCYKLENIHSDKQFETTTAHLIYIIIRLFKITHTTGTTILCGVILQSIRRGLFSSFTLFQQKCVKIKHQFLRQLHTK